jgi:hypothetical protein
VLVVSDVWDSAFDGDNNVVELHISPLSRKLGTDVIETIRSGGYRIRSHGGGTERLALLADHCRSNRNRSVRAAGNRARRVRIASPID